MLIVLDLQVIPHKQFTFAKIWLLFAMLEVRQKEVTRARKILGAALGKCPKPRLFKGYIELEIKLREFDRCRILYEKFLEFQPENCETWIKVSNRGVNRAEISGPARKIFFRPGPARNQL